MAFTLFPKSIRFFDLLIQQNEILKDVAIELEQIFDEFNTTDEAFKRITTQRRKGRRTLPGNRQTALADLYHPD